MMRFALAIMAVALTAAPISAQDTNAANTSTNQMAVPANTGQPVLPVTNEMAGAPAPVSPAPSRGHNFPWGLIGLVGLVGLLGRARS
jgi:hypothetical protein